MTEFLRVSFEVKDSWRLGVLSELLGLKYFAAVGLAVLLAAWADKNRVLCGMPELPQKAIAQAVGWSGSAKRLFDALAQVKIYARDDEGEYLDFEGIIISKREAERQMTRERVRASRRRKKAGEESAELYTPDTQGCEKLYKADANNAAVKERSFTDDAVTKALQKRDQNRDGNAENETGDETPSPHEGNAKADPSLPPPFPPYDLLFSPVSLPKGNNITETAAAAAATAAETQQKSEWEELLDEICPPGNAALREIRGFIERGISEELVFEVVRDAALSGARSPKYVIAILERCEAQGIKTVTDFRQDAQNKKKSAPGYRRITPGRKGFIKEDDRKMSQGEIDTLIRLGFDFGDTRNKMTKDEMETLERYAKRQKELEK